MKKACMVLLVLFAVCGFSVAASAALAPIGTATYGGSSYNLIYEDVQSLVWLDYSRVNDTWQNQMNWASGLNNSGVLTYNLYEGISVSWEGPWRLPATVDGNYSWGYNGTTIAGFNITTSEMGHLFYVSLGNLGYYDTGGWPQSGGGSLTNTGPFDNLQAELYWSGTEFSNDPSLAWHFIFGHGQLSLFGKASNGSYALAVRPGEVSAVPVPASVILLASGLLGLVGLGRRFKK